MYKPFIVALCCAFTFVARAQSPALPVQETQLFGKIDKADLEMKACAFEPDANAEVLFDKADMWYGDGVVIDRHKRVKIFNQNGVYEANVRIEYFSIYTSEYIDDIEAETINVTDGKIEITKLDKKQIYTEHVDILRSAIIFSLPNVKAGSVVEFKYRLHTPFVNVPDWEFQSNIPERYNELTTAIPDILSYKVELRTNQPFFKDIASSAPGSSFNYDKHVRAMVNVKSFVDEPFMSSRADNVQSIHFQITAVTGNNNVSSFFNSWNKVGKFLINNRYFGYELNTHLSGQKELLDRAKLLKDNDQKISLIFNEVKNKLKWNNINTWYTNDGVSKAWDLKTGNSTEINIILYNLLKSAGIDASPFMVSTHKHGKINPAYPGVGKFDRAVVYATGSNGANYILDASDKYNLYNDTPADLLNSFGLLIDNEHQAFKTIFIDNPNTVNERVFINAGIKPDGTMEGVAQKSSFGYFKKNAVERYDKEGVEKYKTYLKGGNSGLNITDLKMGNMDVDSLPLTQEISFKTELNGQDGDYIYLNPDVFSPFRKNPLVSGTRLTDIDFSYNRSFFATAIYQLPAGFKIDAIPKNTVMTMPDNSISFSRLIAEQDGLISVRYSVNYNRSIFLKEDYNQLKEFYTKMYEMLNEQIVLKKI